jgi:carboxymethylenebutenolidase
MPDDIRTTDLLDSQKKSLAPAALPVGRRGFLAGAGIATGFTLTAGPVQAQTIILTDTKGLTAGTAKVPTADGKRMDVYYARPAEGKNFATIIVAQEIFGVHEHIKDVCRRLAKIGYLAIAPDYYFRAGDATKMPDVPTLLREIIGKVPDTQIMSDIDSTVKWAAGPVGKGDTRKLGITGFCMGGRITWIYTAHNPGVKAAVAWYGPVEGQVSEMRSLWPSQLVARINAPVLGLYGGADAGIPNEGVDRMREALRAAGKTAEIVSYPDTPHAFHADYRPSYREAAAKDGWRRLEVWFSRYLA